VNSAITTATVCELPDTKAVTSEQKATATNDENYALNISVVYQDDQTRQWAREVCMFVRELVGKDSIRATWWNLHALHQPAVLARAVPKATHSDVIVVAIRAASELPLAFYRWADAWL
jgi:hypothetical protein